MSVKLTLENNLAPISFTCVSPDDVKDALSSINTSDFDSIDITCFCSMTNIVLSPVPSCEDVLDWCIIMNNIGDRSYD